MTFPPEFINFISYKGLLNAFVTNFLILQTVGIATMLSPHGAKVTG